MNVSEVMSSDVFIVSADQTLQEAARSMAEPQVRRLPVLNREKRLVGIVSLGDLSQRADLSLSGEALQGVSE